jgi:hypothetical protein
MTTETEAKAAAERIASQVGKFTLTTIGAVFMLLFVPIYIAPIWILDGWILTKVWAWFFQPFFHLNPLPVTMAIAIILVVRLLFVRHGTPKDTRGVVESFLSALCYSLMLFVLGYFLHLWIMR